MNVIILAAGYSTRLRPLTDDTPKPLLTVGSSTILELILERAQRIEDLRKVLVVVNEKFYSQFDDWRKEFARRGLGRLDIELLNDGTTSNETRLGAMGDICLALQGLGCDEDVLIIAGDNMFEGDLQTFIDLRNRHDASVLGVHKYPSLEEVRRKFGVVTVADDGRVMDFEEKPDDPKSSLAATAIYLLRREDLKHLLALNAAPHTGELNAGLLIRELLQQGEKVYCVEMRSWYDIGTHEDLAKVREYYGSTASA